MSLFLVVDLVVVLFDAANYFCYIVSTVSNIYIYLYKEKGIFETRYCFTAHLSGALNFVCF